MISQEEIEMLEKLLKLEQLESSIKNCDENLNPNYIALFKAISQQKYDDSGKLIAGYRGFALEGSSRCFHSGQKIVTKTGSKPISELKKGDFVLSYNEKNQKKEYCPVIENIKFDDNKKKCFKITLKNGRIIKVTEDHKFYDGKNWKPIKDIINEWDIKKRE